MKGNFTFDVKSEGSSSLVVKNLKIEGTTSAKMAVISQDQSATAGQFSSNVTLENCTLSNFASKGLYLTNAKSLNLKNCTFTGCAGTAMDEPNTKGDYVVDLNLIGVQDVVVNIENCTFDSNGAKKANIKVACRGGESDAGASDIPKDVAEATVSNMSIKGCTFTNTAEGAVDVNIGTTSKTEGDVVNTTGQYPVIISSNKTDAKVSQPFNDLQVIVPAGATYTKDADWNIGIEASVKNQAELLAAMTTADINKIHFANNIAVADELQSNHPVMVYGDGRKVVSSVQGKTLIFTKDSKIYNLTVQNTADNAEWNSSYGIQFYTGKHLLKNACCFGGNAAVLVNGATLDLHGTLNVSNNSFGGVEVSKGAGADLKASVLNINEAVITNSTEAYGKPTIWVDGTSADIGVVNGADALTLAVVKEQNQYYLDAKNAVDPAN